MTQTTHQGVHEYRIERYLEMNFTEKEAGRLAEALGDDGFALDYRRVRKAIENGCSHKQAVRIFT